MIAIVFASASGQTVHPVTRSMSYADISNYRQSPAEPPQSPLHYEHHGSVACVENSSRRRTNMRAPSYTPF